MNPDRSRQLALLLLSAALIALQLILMQILSITQWHHFAYLVISAALLGFGASGTLLALTRSWCLRHSTLLLPLLLATCALSMAMLGWLTQGLLKGFDSYLLFLDGSQVIRLFAVILCFLLPFLLGATAIGLIFMLHIKKIGSLYFVNLLGSGLGGVCGLALLWLLPPQQLTPLVAVAPLLASALLLPKNAPRCRQAFLLCVIMTVAAFFFPAPLALSQYKDIQRTLNLPEARIQSRRASPYGLVETVSAPSLRFVPGLSLNYHADIPTVDLVFNNGNQFGAILPQAPDEAFHLLQFTSGALPFAISEPRRVLILHSGTGTEVGLALAQGAKNVTAVEPHSAMLELLQENYAGALGYLFDNPSVTLINREPRNFLASTKEDFDLILLPTLGAFGGTLGLFALQQQHSLTLEGLSAAWQRLRPHSLLCVNSWVDFPPRTPLRLATSIGKFLEEQGINNPTAHVAAVRSWGAISFCVKRSPLTVDERKRIRVFCRQRLFDPLLLSETELRKEPRFNTSGNDDFLPLLTQALSNDRNELIRRYPFNLEPTSDDRPFFSQFLRWQHLPQLSKLFGARSLPFLELGFLLVLLTFLLLSGAAVILILLPLLKLGWRGGHRGRTLLYFGGLGCGFMLVEISLIHSFTLYLGHPVYAAAAIISIVLLLSGIGSYLSTRVKESP
ncbi:MAG: class I SAM-dependent methyltransferase, partial [Deltaproteobacteria bacterium]|nr:class I SAM-dependent methyltransferase [Deltaproteobacteria bacterium]